MDNPAMAGAFRRDITPRRRRMTNRSQYACGVGSAHRMRMTKVLHVFYNFLPDLTGSSIRSAGLISGQLSRGIRIAAVSSPFQPGFGSAPVEEYRGATIYRAHEPGSPTISDEGSSLRSRFRKVASFPRFVALVRRIARAERATIIHAHSTFYCALAAYLAARSLGLKVVYEFRSLWEERARNLGLLYRAQGRISRCLESLSLRLVDHVVAINEGLKAEVVARGIAPSKITVVPNAVDDALIELGGRFEPPSRVTRFGYVGNISPIEGLDVLVHAFGRAFPDREDVTLVFHGAGPYEAELRRLIESAEDPRISFLGRFTRDAVQEVYRTVDCVVLPRHRTKLNDTVTPLKPLEAMAFGRLVGVSDAAGLLEVIGDRTNAWVFPADDIDQLASGLRGVYEGRLDCREMASRGRAFVTQHRAWSAIARTYQGVYGSLRRSDCVPG